MFVIKQLIVLVFKKTCFLFPGKNKSFNAGLNLIVQVWI